MSDVLECGKYNSDDCKAEWRNAKRNKKLPTFYKRCREEKGAQPLRSRCNFAAYSSDAPLRYEHTRSYGKHDASPHYLLGSRLPEISQCVTAPDASGGRWRVLRFGPFVSEGGWDWHSGHVDDVFRLAQGDVATGFFFSPMSEAGAPLGFRPAALPA